MSTNDKESKKAQANKLAKGEFDFDEFREKASKLFNRHRSVIIGAFVAVFLIIGGLYYYFIGYKYPMEKEAQVKVYKAQAQFEQDSIEVAVKGDANRGITGFTEVIEDYGGTVAANNTHYQVGVAMIKKGQFEDAIKFLSKYSSKDPITQAMAYGLIGDAYSSLDQADVEQALNQYEKAANHTRNPAVASLFLKKAALWCEEQKDTAKATNFYKRIQTEYPDLAERMEIEKDLIRLTKMY